MENKKLIKLATISDTILRIIQILLIIAAIFLIAFGVYINFHSDFLFNRSTITLGNYEFILNEEGINNLFIGTANSELFILLWTFVVGFNLGLTYYGTKVLRGIIKPMKEGLPFSKGISKAIRAIGWISLISGFTSQIASFMSEALVFRNVNMLSFVNMEYISGYNIHYTLSSNFIGTVLVIFLISYIFEYGEKLQKESDETL